MVCLIPELYIHQVFFFVTVEPCMMSTLNVGCLVLSFNVNEIPASVIKLFMTSSSLNIARRDCYCLQFEKNVKSFINKILLN